MSWRFRKSFSVLPGVRLNVSRSGISTTIGSAPFSVNLGPRGVYATASVPGTGISARHRLGVSPSVVVPRPPDPESPPPTPIAPRGHTTLPPVAEIRSNGTEQLTSAGLVAFRNLLRSAETERTQLEHEIHRASPVAKADGDKYENWSRGWLFRRLRPRRFHDLARIAEESSARLAELKEQLSLASLATEIDLPSDLAASFHRLCDQFSAMAASSRIWDTVASRATNQRVERTVAHMAVSRESVRFGLGHSDLLKCEWRVPHLGNRNGGDLFIYPGFVLYRVSRDAFAVIETRDVEMRYAVCQFHEMEGVPPDSEVVGHTWTKANKDGSPDRRFRDNRQIPIARYGQLTITSSSGLHEEYLLSRSEDTERFVADWRTHRAALASR